MLDNNLPNTTQVNPVSGQTQTPPPSVDDYVPPASTSDLSDSANPAVFPATTSDSTGPTVSPTFASSPTDPTDQKIDQADFADKTDSAPTAMSTPTDVSDTQVGDDIKTGDDSQSLETQNIFDLLGVSDGTEKEKEDFLDELQEVIWEDFVENDVDLLLTQAEAEDFAGLKAKGDTPEVQEEMLAFLEKLIPDLEEIMMDKALELKSDMVQERISGMKEFHAGNAEALAQIAKAEEAMAKDRWKEVGEILNGIKA